MAIKTIAITVSFPVMKRANNGQKPKNMKKGDKQK